MELIPNEEYINFKLRFNIKNMVRYFIEHNGKVVGYYESGLMLDALRKYTKVHLVWFNITGKYKGFNTKKEATEYIRKFIEENYHELNKK